MLQDTVLFEEYDKMQQFLHPRAALFPSYWSCLIIPWQNINGILLAHQHGKAISLLIKLSGFIYKDSNMFWNLIQIDCMISMLKPLGIDIWPCCHRVDRAFYTPQAKSQDNLICLTWYYVQTFWPEHIMWQTCRQTWRQIWSNILLSKSSS